MVETDKQKSVANPRIYRDQVRLIAQKKSFCVRFRALNPLEDIKTEIDLNFKLLFNTLQLKKN